MLKSLGLAFKSNRPRLSKIGYCEEKNRLVEAFLDAVHALSYLQNEQAQAVIDGEPDFCRFDILLHCAQEKKDAAKYAWIAHVEAHGCHGEGGDQWD